MAYLDELNERQREAVTHTEGPLLIIAGAGAGKTKTITHRILHLIQKGVAPHAILAVTFTNKAASEMKERVLGLMEKEGVDKATEGIPTVSTFHALSAMILRSHAEQAGVRRHFTIYDRTDSLRAVKEAIKQSGLPEKQFEPKTLLGSISKQKGEGHTASSYKEESTRAGYYGKILSEVWEKYDRILEREGSLDFDDLLLKTMLLLEKNTEVRAHYEAKWRYIHVDEYQDTNGVQFRIARALAKKSTNICVVGDIDQNIYSWRGASIDNILDFEKEFPGARTVVLEQNYRSTKTIVHVSNKIIEKNLRRKKKVVFTENAEGELISFFSAYDELDEAKFIAHKARALIESGVPAQEIAVLYRANYQSRALEEAFLKEQVSYKVLGVRFFDRKEIKDTLSYIRASLNRDSLGDIGRIANVPARGIGKITLIKMLANEVEELPISTQKKIRDFYSLLDAIRECSETKNASEVIKFVLEHSGLLASFERTKNEEEAERAENLRELVTLATKYDTDGPMEGIEALLEHAALESDQDRLDKNEAAVTLMTVHAAKGLEFRHVFVSGLEEGLFPHERLSNTGVDEEEERRLFYVAITRAKEKLYLTHASVRTIFGSRQVNLPSQFLADIDNEFIVEEKRTEKLERVIYLDLDE